MDRQEYEKNLFLGKVLVLQHEMLDLYAKLNNLDLECNQIMLKLLNTMQQMQGSIFGNNTQISTSDQEEDLPDTES